MKNLKASVDLKTFTFSLYLLFNFFWVVSPGLPEAAIALE